MFLGLRSLIYSTDDLEAAKAWYTKVLGVEPYYDESPYAGYDVGGYELGLFAAGDPAACPATYWGVPDVDAAVAFLLDAGATPGEPVTDVGGGIRLASVRDPQGHEFGIIENPHFEVRPVESSGPGR